MKKILPKLTTPEELITWQSLLLGVHVVAEIVPSGIGATWSYLEHDEALMNLWTGRAGMFVDHQPMIHCKEAP